uniref:ANK_REP_REGION domain-containing protein n=2 Tax=Onchocerca volvulus TaxID=6282 RepID=A0A8R1Y174_ONCVO
MGNGESSGTEGEGARKQNKSMPKLYRFVDMYGGGELIPWMKYAKDTGDSSIIDEFIETKLKEFMYNSGKGKMVAVAELVKIRNKERNAMLSALKRKKGKGKSGPNILDEFRQEGENQGDLKKALKLLEGDDKRGKSDWKYREVTWKLDERGLMGENLVGVCLLQGTAIHNQLAIKLIKAYPKLVNDIFISEDYYGLSPLHQAIINEDPAMVLFLLRHGADINQRCYGAFFCPDDQKGSRTDSLEHEYVELSLKTTYNGRMYFGEYPLSFAACINQTDCYRILLAKHADPNRKDTNGNTVLHLAVIHEQPEMLKLCYDTGAKLQIMNNRNLTPLTLAAHLAKKEMFEQILKLEADVIWMYGDASSHAYPLAKLDTINQETGELNEDSALSLIVYGETTKHLQLLDGLLGDLLEVKWESFGRMRLAISFGCYLFFYICTFTAFMCRPLSFSNAIFNMDYLHNMVLFENTTSLFNSTLLEEGNSTRYKDIQLQRINADYPCNHWRYFGRGWQQTLRLIAELAVLLMTIFQVVDDAMDIHSIGRKRWWRLLKSFPAKIAYKISFILILLIIPFRLMCSIAPAMLFFDNALSLLVVLLISVHFLFYSRAIKFIGPFVLMIYTILSRDLSRFFLIYAIFLIGFSQSFYIIFMSCTRQSAQYQNVTASNAINILYHPMEAVMRIFIMTIGEFMVFYRKMVVLCGQTSMAYIGKVMFVIYELFVSVMQLNLLIAMMGRTYDLISGTQTEWKRQWAQVILMLEFSLRPKARLNALLKYSRPIGTNKRERAFVIVRKTGDSLSETDKQLRELQEQIIREKKRALLKRRLKDRDDLRCKRL